MAGKLFKISCAAIFIIAALFTAGCRCGAPYAVGAGTVDYYARLHINELAERLTVGVFSAGDHVGNRPANIIDTQIITFEKVAEFDSIATDMVELWRLDFALLTDDFECCSLRWGTFSPDSAGLVGHHTGWNDARVLLVFTRAYDDGNRVIFHGSIPWYTEETYGMEEAARMLLLIGGNR